MVVAENSEGDEGDEPFYISDSPAREAMYFLLHPEMHEKHGHKYGPGFQRLSQCFQCLIIILILINIIVCGLSMMGGMSSGMPSSLTWIINVFTCVVFSFEYAARLWVCVEAKENREKSFWQVRLQFIVSPMSLM